MAPTRIGCLNRLKRLRLDRFAFFTHIAYHRVDAAALDDAHGMRGHFQGNPAIFLHEVETLFLQVRQEAPTRFSIGVRYVVAHNGAFSGDIANVGHGANE